MQSSFSSNADSFTEKVGLHNKSYIYFTRLGKYCFVNDLLYTGRQCSSTSGSTEGMKLGLESPWSNIQTLKSARCLPLCAWSGTTRKKKCSIIKLTTYLGRSPKPACFSIKSPSNLDHKIPPCFKRSSTRRRIEYFPSSPHPHSPAVYEPTIKKHLDRCNVLKINIYLLQNTGVIKITTTNQTIGQITRYFDRKVSNRNQYVIRAPNSTLVSHVSYSSGSIFN